MIYLQVLTDSAAFGFNVLMVAVVAMEAVVADGAAVVADGEPAVVDGEILAGIIVSAEDAEVAARE